MMKGGGVSGVATGTCGSSLPPPPEELREAVIKTLESKGVLNTMRAQLRAHVYSAMSDVNELPNVNNPTLQRVLETSDGKLCLQLVREFLAFCKLEHTLSVFVPECNLQTSRLLSREDLSEQLHLGAAGVDTQHPVIYSVLSALRHLHATPISPRVITANSTAPSSPPKYEPNESYPKSPRLLTKPLQADPLNKSDEFNRSLTEESTKLPAAALSKKPVLPVLPQPHSPRTAQPPQQALQPLKPSGRSIPVRNSSPGNPVLSPLTVTNTSQPTSQRRPGTASHSPSPPNIQPVASAESKKPISTSGKSSLSDLTDMPPLLNSRKSLSEVPVSAIGNKFNIPHSKSPIGPTSSDLEEVQVDDLLEDPSYSINNDSGIIGDGIENDDSM
ncbi:FGFR1 oncogene partner [Pelomyxa schiedti]|nr:FGFR1 oncogene partner [Pelomyxa schiedti]